MKTILRFVVLAIMWTVFSSGSVCRYQSIIQMENETTGNNSPDDVPTISTANLPPKNIFSNHFFLIAGIISGIIFIIIIGIIFYIFCQNICKRSSYTRIRDEKTIRNREALSYQPNNLQGLDAYFFDDE